MEKERVRKEGMEGEGRGEKGGTSDGEDDDKARGVAKVVLEE